MHRGAVGGVLLALASVLLTGCTGAQVAGRAEVDGRTAADRALVLAYLVESNATAADGAPAQQQFFADTQHPDFPAITADCADATMEELTVEIEPTRSTIRLDPQWRYPDSAGDVPAGRSYVLAARLTLRQAGNELATVIGAQHVVVLDGRAVSFAPCLR